MHSPAEALLGAVNVAAAAESMAEQLHVSDERLSLDCNELSDGMQQVLTG